MIFLLLYVYCLFLNVFKKFCKINDFFLNSCMDRYIIKNVYIIKLFYKFIFDYIVFEYVLFFSIFLK